MWFCKALGKVRLSRFCVTCRARTGTQERIDRWRDERFLPEKKTFLEHSNEVLSRGHLHLVGVLYNISPLPSCSSSSSETQGQIAEARESENGRKKMATKKNIVGREEPLGTSSYETSSKQQRSFSILIGARNSLCFSAQSEVSRPWSRLVSSYTEITWYTRLGLFGKALLEEKSLNHSTKMKMYRKSFGISAEKYAEPFAGIVTAAYFQVCEIFFKMSSPIHLIK